MSKKKEDKKTIELEQKCGEYEAGWKRALADYKNLQNQISTEIDASKSRICINFAQDLLPVMDNFNQAVEHAPPVEDQSDEIKSWLQGILYIKKQMEDVMAGLGAEKIEPEGTFNPNEHEAAGMESHDDIEEYQIIKIIQPGWKIGDRIIRPARVIINEINDKDSSS